MPAEAPTRWGPLNVFHPLRHQRSVINVFIRPIVMLLTLPANLLTFGILGIVINAFLFYFAARLVHISVDFWRAALGWLAFSIISAALSQVALSE